jgi:hypothetical protein
VDAIVHAHDGRLTITSEPGSGTRIEVELPDLVSRAGQFLRRWRRRATVERVRLLSPDGRQR